MSGRQSFIRGLALGGIVMLAGAVLVQTGARAMTVEEIAMLKGPDRANILAAGAKKEGMLTFYSTLIVNQALRPLAEGFMKANPEIKVDIWRGATNQVIQKMMAEQRARNIVGDVAEMGGGAMAAIKGNAVVPFTTPINDEYAPEYVDKKHLWTATRVSYFGTAYNTKQVQEADLPKSFDDLLDPRWKGKLSWRANSETGAELFLSNLITLRGEKATDDYAKKLAQQKVVNYSGSARALVDRVGQGEYPMAINIFAHHPLISAKKGAPLDVVMLDPIPVNISTIQLIKGTTHPHAAMMLIDFVLSKEGQTILRRADYFPAHPQVDPDLSMAKVIPRLIGKKENVFDPTLIDEVNAKSKVLFSKYFR